MITAEFKYIGKLNGTMAEFFKEPKVTAKFDTLEEVQEYFNKWSKILRSPNDWVFIIK